MSEYEMQHIFYGMNMLFLQSIVRTNDLESDEDKIHRYELRRETTTLQNKRRPPSKLKLQATQNSYHHIKKSNHSEFIELFPICKDFLMKSAKRNRL
jgi:hypothetical protein